MKALALLPAALLMTLVAACGQGKSTASSVQSAGSGTDAFGWCHAPAMRSTDATNLAFDYQVSLLPDYDHTHLLTNLAVQPWISVSKFGFQGTETVKVAFMTYSISTKGLEEYGMDHKYLMDTQTITLHWDANAQKYTGQPQTQPFLGSYYVGDDQTNLAVYQYAVQVNDQWLTDPISGSHNFQFVPMQQTQGICEGQHFSNSW